MEMYKKPVMEILELEKVDVLTASCKDPNCYVTEELDANGYCPVHQNQAG